jgi:hypothetical protein
LVHRLRALESGQLSAAVATIREMGVLSGMRVERKEVGQPGDFLLSNLSGGLIERCPDRTSGHGALALGQNP